MRRARAPPGRPIWTNGGLHEAVVLISLPIASTTSGFATAKPIRQPLMLYDLLKV